MKSLESLVRTFAELHPEDAAHAFELLDSAESLRLMKSLPVRVAATLLERLSPHTAGPLLARLDAERIEHLLAEMSPRAACLVLNQLDDDPRQAVLDRLPTATARTLREISAYSADTAGGIMEPRVASLPIDLTAQQAIATIRKTPRDVLHYLYVTDRERKLVGVLNMRDLLLAAPRDAIESMVKRDVLCVPATTDREEVVNLMRERKFLALPVVDFDGRLVGVVKHNEALEAGQLEAFEDLQKIVGAGADERALSPVSTVVKSRLPWLYVNLGTAFLASVVVGLFEGTIAEIAALAVLLPVVAGQGGNTGSQSLAVVMRGLALREIVPGVKKRVIRKELWGGIINGAAVAVVTGLAVFAWRMLRSDPLVAGVALAAVISMAMLVNMAAAAFSGAVIPLILKAMGRDPAQSSSIFLTTVTDIVGFASFLGFATIFMSYLK
jgi:magnesium transporter